MKFLIIHIPLFLLMSFTISAQKEHLVPLPVRVDIQSEPAQKEAVVDEQWVGVGIKKPYAIQHDHALLFEGLPSYRFELRAEDNTLQDYREGDTKGRAELSYCYAIPDSFRRFSKEEFENIVKTKTVYHYGKGYCRQAANMEYRFSVYVPSALPDNVNTIFAQWHGMPERTLVQTPSGEIKKISNAEFAGMLDSMVFNKDTGYDKIFAGKTAGGTGSEKRGREKYTLAKKPNGWMVEQGGYPPMAFGFSSGYFYIKTNSDRKYLTDKSDRCNANPDKSAVFVPVTSEYKTSTIVYKVPFADFPKNKWISFCVRVLWTKYGGIKETVEKPGYLDISMSYKRNGTTINEKLVENKEVLVGRNDEFGYYFKFGIYRVGNSKIPVSYNLAGYTERMVNF